jgi:hypothetical protein
MEAHVYSMYKCSRMQKKQMNRPKEKSQRQILYTYIHTYIHTLNMRTHTQKHLISTISVNLRIQYLIFLKTRIHISHIRISALIPIVDTRTLTPVERSLAMHSSPKALPTQPSMITSTSEGAHLKNFDMHGTSEMSLSCCSCLSPVLITFEPSTITLGLGER